MAKKKTYLTVSDNFCGAGGNSIGVRNLANRIGGGLELVEAANHWKVATDTYSRNFPNARVILADLQQMKPERATSTDIHFSSPSCQKHSKASGLRRKHQRQVPLFDDTPLKAADIRSRETMMCVPHYAEVHNYNAIVVENVVDVHDWAGFDAWLMYMDRLGYRCQRLYLNSMFFKPCPQSRDRVYFVFTKKKNKKPDLEFRPKAHCPKCERDVESIQSFNKGASPKAMYGVQYHYICPTCTTRVTPYYYAAFNAIDWSIPSERIGDRKRPLVANTMRRIEHGWKKYGDKPLLVKNMHGSGLDCRVREAAASPMFSVHAKAGMSIVFPWIIDFGHEFKSNGQFRSTAEMFRTFNTGQTTGIAWPPGFLATQRGTSPAHLAAASNGFDEAMTTISAAGNHHGLVTLSAFVSAYYGTGTVNKDVTDSLSTIRTKQAHALVNVPEAPTCIEDLYYRMLRSHEHGRGMAFPDDYVVTGNEAEQTKQYGNAVTPPVSEFIMERLLPTFW